MEKVKNIRVVIPNTNSKLVELIKNSNELKKFLRSEYKNIGKGSSKNNYFKRGIEFKMPSAENIVTKQWRDKATLFGVIHNADVYDTTSENNGTISLIISDLYDYDNWWGSKDDTLKNLIIKFLNNNAYWQQEAGKLMPYILYIPIEYTIEDILRLFAN